MKLGQNICLDEVSDKLKNYHVRSKTRSSGQIFKKSCVRSGGQIFSPIIMKRRQNLCLDDFYDEYENGSCPVKNYVTRSDLRFTVQKAQVSDSRAIMALLFLDRGENLVGKGKNTDKQHFLLLCQCFHEKSSFPGHWFVKV